MTREVYSDREFIKFSRSQVFMRVFEDTDSQGAQLARKFRIRGTPTLIILNSAGQEIDRIVGGMSAQELMEELESIFQGKKNQRITL
jgi:thioredoxin-related protein